MMNDTLTTMRRRKKRPGRKAAPFTVYLSPDLDLWLRELAQREGRKLTTQTERVLRAGRAAMESGGTESRQD